MVLEADWSEQKFMVLKYVVVDKGMHCGNWQVMIVSECFKIVYW